MSAVRTSINAGICGFVTQATARCGDGQLVRFQVESPCERIQQLGTQLNTLDAFAEIGAGFDGELHKAVRKSLKGCCSGCVVPAGLFKAMQIAAGLALPKAATLEFERIAEEK